jgi:predicted ATPase
VDAGALPVHSTRFIGRVDEVSALAECVRGTSMVTLTGVGGVGKTRLAIRVASELGDSFRDGARFVDLGGVVSSDAVADAVATSVGFSAGTGAAGGLVDFLRRKELLLLVDNCEHLLGPVADLVEDVLHAAPGVHVLATSREGLGVAGEHVRVVPSLSLPAADNQPSSIAAADACALFMERAKEASSSFGHSDGDAATIAELCRRLDGIPLAIELAAARVGSMTPTEIAAHLDKRFKLLTGGRRAAITRQRTLHNAIEWSYQLLEPDEQAVFDGLAVFAGGFDVSAAQAVVADGSVDEVDVLDLLARLVAKSLVLAERRDTTTRYRMLETVREFAWERLDAAGATDAVGRRHAEHFARFAKEAGAGLRSPDEARWRGRIRWEQDNLRAALAWAIAADEVQLALEPIGDLAVFGDLSSPYGMLAAEAAEMRPDHPFTAVALAAACWAAAMRGDGHATHSYGAAAREHAAALDRSPEGLWVRCRVNNATTMDVSYMSSSATELEDHCRRCVTDARELGDPWSLVEALTFCAAAISDRPESIRAAEEALAVADMLGVPSRISFAAGTLASRIVDQDPIRAEQLIEMADAAAARAGNGWADYFTAFSVAQVYASIGEPARAAQRLVAFMERSAGRNDYGGVLVGMVGQAAVFATTADVVAALVLASWCDQRGFSAAGMFDNWNRALPSLGVPRLDDLRATRTSDELEQISRKADALDDEGIVKLARELLTPN